MSEINLLGQLSKALVGLDQEQRDYVMRRVEQATPQVMEQVAMQARQELVSEKNRKLKAGYDAEVMKLAQGDVYGLHKLKEAYRKMGLDIW